MEQSFWFILIGVSIYVLHSVWKNRPSGISCAVDVAVGIFIGVWIGYTRSMNFGFGPLPLWFTGGMGGLTAIILWLVDHLQLLTRQALKYSIVIVLSLIHAGISYSVFMFIRLSPVSAVLSHDSKTRLFFHILLVSAVSLVGYTFPARILRTPSGKARPPYGEESEEE
jgi:cytochrome c oxidase subunit IV